MVAELILMSSGHPSQEPGRQCAQYLARALSSLEVQVREQISLCVTKGELQKAISTALSRSDLIMLLGGLDKASGYLTKEILSQGLRLPLVLDDACLESLYNYCRKAGDTFFPGDEELAKIPQGARAFPGEHGKIPGFVISSAKQHIIALPDSQAEAASLFPKYIAPLLGGPAAETTVTRTVRTYGVKEEQVRAQLCELLDGVNPAVTLEREGSEILIHVSTHAPSAKRASSLCTPVLRAIVERVGDAAYGLDVDSLQSAVAGKLTTKDLDIAVADAGCGGILARVLSETPGGADVLRYSVRADADTAKQEQLGISPRLLKKYGGVSEQAAVAMADAARRKAGTMLGAAICACTGPDTGGKNCPVGLVYIAVCDVNNVYVKKLVVGSGASRERDIITDASLSRALNMIRLFVDYLPNRYKGAIPLAEALAGKTVTAGDSSGASDSPSRGAPFKKSFFKCLANNFIIRKADDTITKIRKIIFIIAVLVFLGSAAYIGSYYYGSWQSAKKNNALSQMFTTEGLDESKLRDDVPADILPEFALLWSYNQDVTGYLNIDDTKIQYPVMQGADNNIYLRRDFYKESDRHGIPFLDFRNNVYPGEVSDNLVIYGHNMKDGQMFGELTGYRDLDFYKEHPIIDFTSLYEENQYKVFAVFITNAYSAQGPVFQYHNYIDFPSDESFADYVNKIRVRSLIGTDVDVLPGDKLLILSTCDYDFTEARVVVAARQVREDESIQVNTDKAVENAQPLYPDIWYRTYGGSKPTGVDDSVTVAGYDLTVTASTQGASSQNTDDLTSSSTVELQPPASQSSQAPSSQAPSSQAPSSQAPSSQAPSSQAPSSQAPSSQAPSSQAPPPVSESSQEPSQASEESSQVSEASSESSRSSSREPTLFDNLPSSSSDDDRDDSDDLDLTSASGMPGLTYAMKIATAPMASLFDGLEDKSTGDSVSGPSIFDGLDIDPPRGRTYNDDNSSSSGSSGGSIFGGRSSGNSGSSGSTPRTVKDTLTVSSNGKKVTGDASSIIARIVQTEIGSGFHEEALKAQAVAAYSYILYYNNQGQTPSVLLSAESAVTQKVRNAVDAVLYDAVYYKSNVALTCYHATSAGQTTSSKDVWGGDIAYLVSVDSSVDKKTTNYKVTRTFTSDAVSDLLYSKLGVDTEGDPEDWFEILSYYDGGYVGEVSVCGSTRSSSGTRITGKLLRESVFSLRSHSFTITYNESNDSFTFTTYGYGHGVGMSQNGANLYAQQGWSYKEILEHYFPGCSVG